MYISNAQDWLEKCVNDPRWVAESMQRIGRFGGQHPTANVLIHSLEVAWMLRGSSPDIQLAALYHDAHEILTGDVPRLFKRTQTDTEQMFLDTMLHRAFGIDIRCDSVEKADKACGDAEYQQWGDVIFQYAVKSCVSVFETKAFSLMAKIAATRLVAKCPQ
jgi:hypothetical protein